MATGDITHSKLSGSTDGEWIKVTGNGAGSSVVVHTAGAGTTNTSFVTVYAFNTHTAAVELSIKKGGGDYVGITLGSKRGAILVFDQAPLQNGKTIDVYAATVDVVYIDGRAKVVEG